MSKKSLKGTQNQRILEYLSEHESINFHNALDMGITRLPSRICDLKRLGYSFTKRTKQAYDEDGDFLCNYAEYHLEKGNIDG